MRTFLKVIGFSIFILSLYTIFANIYIPQMKPAPPPAEASLDIGSLTMDKFIAMGDGIFNGKGTCVLCHNPVGGRAPLLVEAGKDGAPIGARAEERTKDARYKGAAKTGEEYIRESMQDPSAFVVATFGVGGTNDTKSPMPDVTKGAIGLKDFEVNAVIAFLQSKAGVDVTVKLPTAEDVHEASEGAGHEGGAPAIAKTPEELITRLGCGACHKVAKEEGALGPDLTKIGGKKKPDYIRKAILEPDVDIAKECPTGPCSPGMMPKDFADKMTAGEFEMLVNYLAKSK